MAMAGVSRDVPASSGTAGVADAPEAAPGAAVMVAAEDPHSEAAAGSRREKFLPVTRHALMDRLTAANLWPNGDAVQARRFLPIGRLYLVRPRRGQRDLVGVEQ